MGSGSVINDFYDKCHYKKLNMPIASDCRVDNHGLSDHLQRRLIRDRRIYLELPARNGLPIEASSFVDYPWDYVAVGRQPADLNSIVQGLMSDARDTGFSQNIAKLYPDPLIRRRSAAFTTRFRSGHYIEFLDPGEVDRRLQQLDRFVREQIQRPVNLFAAICAMAEFLIIHPFVDGNGRAARALFHLIMAERDGGRRVIPPIAPVIAHNRFAFISAMLACELLGDIQPLCDFVCAGLAATKIAIEEHMPNDSVSPI